MSNGALTHFCGRYCQVRHFMEDSRQNSHLGMTGRHARQLNIVVGSSAVEGKTATTKSATDHVCYVASSNNVWRLVSVSLTSQIRQLLQVHCLG